MNVLPDMYICPFRKKGAPLLRVGTVNLIRFDQKNLFFEGYSWFKFNNLGLALGMALKFYTSVSKEFKLKVRKFWGLIPTFV